MKSIKERKKLRKVKKKWVVVSAGIWVGLLSTIVAAANPQLIPKSLRQFFPESRVEDLKANPNVQSILHEAFGEQVLDQTGQSIKLNDSVIQQLNEIAQIVSAEQAPDLDGAPEMNLDGQQPDMYLNRQQIEDIVNVVTSEDNHDATPQQILQSAAEIVLDKSEQEPERLTPEIQKVVEHVEKVIELPSVDALEKAEQLKEAQAKADAL
ncbi:MAG: hypothetical protein LBF82_03650, partial [Lactobacillales bacterium]|nr:hypothetical protein [Lactobacillales bacterium]